jgi:hypothetical protein
MRTTGQTNSTRFVPPLQYNLEVKNVEIRYYFQMRFLTNTHFHTHTHKFTPEHTSSRVVSGTE